MLGNVAEWCHDEYGPYSADGGKRGGAGSGWEIVSDEQVRVVRGGSHFDRAHSIRSSHRNYLSPFVRVGAVGFRVARTMPAEHASSVHESAVGDAPIQLFPDARAVLENGSRDRTRLREWTFEWQPVRGASHYHLFVIGPSARNPAIDLDSLTATTHSDSREGAIFRNLKNWRWKVRARIDGEWGRRSDVRTFDVIPPLPNP